MIRSLVRALFFAFLFVFFPVYTVAQHPDAVTAAELPVAVRHFVVPEYPWLAVLARITGNVVADVEINSDGTVHSVDFVSAHPALQKSVETALSQWTFQVSNATKAQITVQFKLDMDCPLEPNGQNYIYTQVSADLPSTVQIRQCFPITPVASNQHR